MRTIYLLRHAKSSWDDPSLDDFDRPLAPRGLKAAPVMGAFMARNGYVPDRVICSAARRARDTWDLAEEKMEEALGRELSTEIREDLYGTSPGGVLAMIQSLPDSVGSVLLVGHNPTMEALALALAETGHEEGMATMERKYPTAALAVLDFAAPRWADVREKTGHLRAFVRPRDLG